VNPFADFCLPPCFTRGYTIRIISLFPPLCPFFKAWQKQQAGVEEAKSRGREGGHSEHDAEAIAKVSELQVQPAHAVF
jgi:hypothetical protein